MCSYTDYWLTVALMGILCFVLQKPLRERWIRHMNDRRNGWDPSREAGCWICPECGSEWNNNHPYCPLCGHWAPDIDNLSWYSVQAYAGRAHGAVLWRGREIDSATVQFPDGYSA